MVSFVWRQKDSIPRPSFIPQLNMTTAYDSPVNGKRKQTLNYSSSEANVIIRLDILGLLSHIIIIQDQRTDPSASVGIPGTIEKLYQNLPSTHPSWSQIP